MSHRLFSLNGKRALITGSSQGIGYGIAQGLAEAGAEVILNGRDAAKLAVAAAELRKAGHKVQEAAFDVTSQASVAEAIAKIEAEGTIDILFNNAGQLTGGLLEEQNLEEIYSMLQVNVNALIHLTHALLPKMLKRKTGKIINHSSVSGMMHFPCSSTYSASKAAVLAFSNSLRAELKGTGVTTLVLITPGVDTRMYKEIPKLYGGNLDVSFLRSIPPKKYADMIREAVIEDLEILKPTGFTGIGLTMAQHIPKIFESIVLNRFKRN